MTKGNKINRKLNIKQWMKNRENDRFKDETGIE
jgi:hypothetical protein